MVLSFHERELIRDFEGGCEIRSLRIFSKPSTINEFGTPLPTTVWVGLAMLFPSAWWVVEDFSLGLKANGFLYPLAVGGVRCSVVCLLQISWGHRSRHEFRGGFCLEIGLLVESSLILIRLPHFDMNVETVKRFRKDASRTFFNEFGLISHQINSFNSPSGCLCRSLSRASIDQTRAGRYATITDEKVRLHKPSFWHKGEYQKMLLRHARLQNMTCSSKLKIGACLYTREEW